MVRVHHQKRKRNMIIEEDLSTRIAKRLHHNLKEVKKAAKKVKTFETQRLIKKLKGLRGKDSLAKETSVLESELELLKQTDHEPIAHTALLTKLKKDRILSSNEPVQRAISTILSKNTLPSYPNSKVQSRLLSSKILAMEVTATIEDIKNLLQPKTMDEIEQPGGGEEPESIPRPKKAKKIAMTPEAEVDDDEWESGSIVDAGAKVDDGWESGSVRSAPSDQESEPNALDSSESDSTSKKNPLKSRSNPTSGTKSKSMTSESKFLPSLSVGFIRGDLDSEFSDEDAATEVRKNRRGQRARRAIWEKKYGRNANHTKKEREAMATSKSKWHPGLSDRIYSNVTSRARPRSPQRGRNQDQQSPIQYTRQLNSGLEGRNAGGTSNRGTSAPAVNTGRKREERALHPSWEAKRKLKEKQGDGILPSQGKKIKF